jgi:hypothetical protein
MCKKFLNTDILVLEEEVGYFTDRETVNLEFYLFSGISCHKKFMNVIKQAAMGM